MPFAGDILLFVEIRQVQIIMLLRPVILKTQVDQSLRDMIQKVVNQLLSLGCTT